MGLRSKKSITAIQVEASDEGQGTLRRALGATNLTMLGIGAIVGAGIFVLTGTAAAQHAGPAIVLSFVLAGLGCLFAGLCYAELAAMLPVAGSAYSYSYAAFGELTAWMIGWSLMLEYLFGAASVAVLWSAYVVEFLRDFGIVVPAAYTQSPFAAGADALAHAPAAVMNLPAMLLVLLLTALLVVGIRVSARVNNAVVFVKTAIVFVVIGFGFMFVNADNWHPFIPDNTGTLGEFGWSGVARGAGVVFFAYVGFDAVSTAAQEAKNPQRDVPIGILASLAICSVLYILMALVVTGLVSYTELDTPRPFDVAIQAAGPGLRWLTYAVNIGAIAGLASVVLVLLVGQPRILWSMARDGLLPPALGRVHARSGTPHVATTVTGIAAALVAGFASIGLLGALVWVGALIAFVSVCAGVIVLRRAQPDVPRPFRAPLVPLVPILGILICFGLMAFLPGDTWIRLLVWLGLGLAIYFLYGKNHSRIGRAEAAAGR